MIDEYVSVPVDSSTYPNELRSSLKDLPLFARGHLGLLGLPAIGICGSREASQEALHWAFRFGQEAASRGLLVVSGYARGIDRQAHKGALTEGGSTIAVLPEGIKNFSVRRELTGLVDLDQNFLAISMFEPAAAWTAWRAMSRNKLIVGLSVGLFVVEAREKGGTINAAMECVKQRKPLWAVAYSDTTPERGGNQILLQEDAIPLKKMNDVKAALDQAADSITESVKQLALEMAGA